MRKILIALMMCLPLAGIAQPFPPNVLPGSPGDGVVYVATRTLGPGTGTNSGTVVYNIFVVTNVAFINNLTNNIFINTNVSFLNSVTNNTFVSTNFIQGNKITVNNFFGNTNYLSLIVLTNGLGRMTNVWAGPTNSVSVALTDPYDLNYVSYTACSVTGITGKSNDLTSDILMSFYNVAATNWNITLASGLMDANGSRTLTVPNGGVGLLWLRYSPQGPTTNTVFKAYPVTPLAGNALLVTDSGGNAISLGNGTGGLTNDNAGGFGWYDYAAYARTIGAADTNYTITATNTSAGYARTLSSNNTNYTDNATNRAITIQGSAVFLGQSTLAAGSTPAFGGINFTNLGYGLPTNNVGGAAFVFGGPGTAATLYDTNITAATTLKLFDISACGATAGGLKIYVTCSGGTDRILTFPSGCSGAGLGTPPAVTITNAKAAFFDVIYKPGATAVTNVFWSPVY